MVTAQALYRRLIVLSLLTAFVFCGITSGLDAVEREKPRPRVRTWTDATGEYQVKASFIDYKDDTVSLRRADGTQVEVAFDRLSASDQKRVQYEARRKAAAQPRTPKVAAAANVTASPERRLYGISWQASPERACEVAATAGDKPVVWFRVLGDLTGYM